MSESGSEGRKTNAVAITAIIVVGIIILACMFSVVAITMAFLANAPW